MKKKEPIQYKIQEVIKKLIKDYDLFVSDDAVYLYEEKGLIKPDRDLGNDFRLYDLKNIKRIAHIAGMSQYLPLGLDFIKQILDNNDLWIKDELEEKIINVKKWIEIAEGYYENRR